MTLALAALLLLTACGADGSADTGSTLSSASAGRITPELDSIAVLGHSIATGTMSDPGGSTRDAHENSWATGENPKVQSIYTRLLKNHPALEGHNYNAAINGANVENLEHEFQTLLEKADPLPDLIIIADFGNDMRCDGTDDANYGLYGQRLDHALTQIEHGHSRCALLSGAPWRTGRGGDQLAGAGQDTATQVGDPCQLRDRTLSYLRREGQAATCWHQVHAGNRRLLLGSVPAGMRRSFRLLHRRSRFSAVRAAGRRRQHHGQPTPVHSGTCPLRRHRMAGLAR